MAAAACLLLAGTLAVAALAKLADRAAFRATLSRLVTPPLARILAVAVPAAELALAAALVCGLGGRLAPAAALLLLLAFTAVLGARRPVPLLRRRRATATRPLRACATRCSGPRRPR